MTEILLWKVQTAALFKEAIENTEQGWALKIPFQIMMNLLAQVAKRAIELNDVELNKLMLRLGLYEITNPSSPKFNPELVEEYLKHGDGVCNKK